MNAQEIADYLRDKKHLHDFEYVLNKLARSHGTLICTIVRKNYNAKYVDCMKKGFLRDSVDHEKR